MRRPFLLASLFALTAAATWAAPLQPDIIVSTSPFIAEGVAMTPQGRLLVSGVHGRTVLIGDGSGFRPWLKPGRFAPVGGLFGMEADPKRGRLWIAETSGADVPGGSGPRRTAILEADLRSGKLLARHAIADDRRDRWLGDLALGRDGSIYASDSKGGGLYHLVHGAPPIRIAELALKSPQGLVETLDGKGLILADYPSGLHYVDLATGQATLLDPGGAGLRGIDGLERDGASLIATQNGGAPNRVLRIRLSGDARTIEGVDILLGDPERADDVALGVVWNGRFTFVAHSQWAATGADGQFTAVPRPARLSSLPLR